MGEQEIRFILNGCIYEHTFGILPLPTDAHGILGMDFLIKMRASINLGKSEIKMAKGEKSNRSSSDRGTCPDEGRQRDKVRQKCRECQAGKRKEELKAIVGSPQVRKYSPTQTSPSRKLPVGQDTSQRKGWIHSTWRAPQISGYRRAQGSCHCMIRGRYWCAEGDTIVDELGYEGEEESGVLVKKKLTGHN
jgi:hypothetical protein